MLTVQKKCPVCFVFSCALVHGYSSAGGNNSAFLPWQESVNVCNYLKFQNTVHHPPSSRREPAGLFQKRQLNPLIPEAVHLSVLRLKFGNLSTACKLDVNGSDPHHQSAPHPHVPTCSLAVNPQPRPLQPTNKEKLFSLPKNTPPSPSPGPCSSLLPGDCRCPHLPVDTVLGTDETHRNQVQMCPLLQGSQQVYKRPALILLVKLSAQDTRNATVTVGYTAEGPATKHRSF